MKTPIQDCRAEGVGVQGAGCRAWGLGIGIWSFGSSYQELR